MPLRPHDMCYYDFAVFTIRLYRTSRFDFPISRNSAIYVSTEHVDIDLLHTISTLDIPVYVYDTSRGKSAYLIHSLPSREIVYRIRLVRDECGRNCRGNDDIKLHSNTIHKDAKWSDIIQTPPVRY